LLAGCGISGLAGALTWSFASDGHSFLFAAQIFALFLGLVWNLACVLVLLQIAGWLWRTRLGRNMDATDGPHDALVLVTSLAIRVWGLALPLAWTLLLQTLQGLESLQAAIGQGQGQGLPFHGDLAEESGLFLRAVVPTMTIHWLLLLILGAVAVWEFFRFSRRTQTGADTHSRILVSPLLGLTIHATTLVYCLESLLVSFTLIYADLENLDCVLSSQEAWTLTNLSVWLLNWLIPDALGISVTACALESLGWIIAGLAALLCYHQRARIRGAVDFALDVTNYFSPEGGTGTVRRQILSRFEAIYTRAAARYPDAKVLFVTHSQGTVLVGDFLGEIDLERPADWVTMGSPISHLYGHYFPDAYLPPRLPDDVTWLNLYRNSDFVGRIVDHAPTNEAIGDGYHSRYFSDARTHHRLEERGLLPSRSDGRVAAPP
ncbi:MAG: hypothetical protein AAFY88_00090, partial [Acidobacteriota bacterium]